MKDYPGSSLPRFSTNNHIWEVHLMTNLLGRSTLVLAFFITLATHAVTAQCFSYGEGDETECWGTNCHGWYKLSFCDVGCAGEFCDGQGNSLNCCGTEYRYAQISEPCHDCGQPPRAHVRESHPNPEFRAELLQGYTPGLVMLSATKSYRPPQLVETYSRCRRTYRLVVEEGRMFTTEEI